MTGTCELCNKQFEFELLHNGFADTSYAYCNDCGNVAVLSAWNGRWPAGVKCTQAEIATEMEQHLEACACGGRFVKGAAPRCPHCGEILSAEKAAVYIEKQAPGTKKGWRWQRDWHGIYCMVVNGKSVSNNFLVEK